MIEPHLRAIINWLKSYKYFQNLIHVQDEKFLQQPNLADPLAEMAQDLNCSSLLLDNSNDGNTNELLVQLLCYAVLESDVKEETVAMILKLEMEDQRELMTLIEAAMMRDRNRNNNDKDNESVLQSPLKKRRTNSMESLSSSSAYDNASLENVTEHQLDNNGIDNNTSNTLSKEVDTLTQEVNFLRQSEAEIKLKLEETQASLTSSQINAERQLIDKEQELKQFYENELKECMKLNEESEFYKKENEEYKSELSTLKDELDVMKHSISLFEKKEDQLRKLKLKLEDLGDVKEQLLKEEEAHAEVLEKVIRLENELASLQPLRRQLESYKTRATEAEVRLVDVQDELRKYKARADELSVFNKTLAQSCQFQSDEANAIQQRLMADATDAQNNIDIQNGIGIGVSELNPALSEEMLRLKNENDMLRKTLAKHSAEALESLEQNLEDSSRLAESFKKQFLSTKEVLQCTEDKLANALATISSLKNTIAIKDTNIQALEKKVVCANNEVKSTIEQSKAEIESIKNEARTEIASVKADCQKEVEQLKGEHDVTLKSVKDTAEKSKNELITKGKGMLAKQKETYESKLESVQQEYDEFMMNTKKSVENYKRKQLEYEQKAQEKITGYKKKLRVAANKLNKVQAEKQDLNQKILVIEKDQRKIAAENDRFRRQVGAKLGADSDLQVQYRTLKSEFETLYDENKKLKKNTITNNSGASIVGARNSYGGSSFMASDSSSFGCSSNSTSAQGVSSHALTNLREEYEETIQKINDEKRELVMKNSALITEKQKTEQRVWSLEDEITKLKDELVSAQLVVQRAHYQDEWKTLRGSSTEGNDNPDNSFDCSEISAITEVSSVVPSNSALDKSTKPLTATDMGTHSSGFVGKENTSPSVPVSRKSAVKDTINVMELKGGFVSQQRCPLSPRQSISPKRVKSPFLDRDTKMRQSPKAAFSSPKIKIKSPFIDRDRMSMMKSPTPRF